ncbi:hypothetical protein GQ53DRAFT_839417 [Thozetella sp. PMI_491]|nr:hypothetical protein GQ53DRAFT_839417 [Thozetella sp. PMI_491]
MASQGEELWVLAQKWRHEVVKETDPLKEDGLDGSELARFEKVEGHLAQYRLACIQAILGDTKFAAEKGIELDLWQTHLLINAVYRKVLHRLSSSHQKSTKRKVDNLYQHFLKVAQEFYRGYLQRISARYGIKELTHALRRLKLSEMELPPESQVNASASGVKYEVIASCHQTLICLGDLARYRTFQRPAEKRNWASALTAYELATSLSPDSGFGHHQTGLIYLETRDYFRAVYYMYRAMGCSRPHELAVGNLNRAFKEVLKPDAFASKKGWTDTAAMTNWFVKLHGRFAKGEERKAYDEMEEEVLHRFSRSLKVEGDANLHDALLKMIVTNIAAYSATVKKTIGHWSEAGSRSCEHLLRWNIRTIHSTARFLHDELAEHLKKLASNPPKEEAPSKTQSAISFGMGLLSVYMTWLCTYSSDLVDFRPHLEPYFADMGKALAQTLTLTLDVVYRSLDSANGASLPFRLAEDEETLGLRCLDGANLPDRCRLQYVSLTGKAKISKEDYNGEYSDEQMLVTRAAHVSCCAVHLGSDPKFPFLYSTTMEDSKPQSTVLFLDEGKAPAAAGTQKDASMLLPLPAASPAEETRPTPTPAIELPASEPPMDDQVFSMVNEFLVPPESPRTATFPQDTANVIQSNPLSPPRRASSTAPAQYPNLPWNFFYTPTPLPTQGQQCLPPSPGYGPMSAPAAAAALIVKTPAPSSLLIRHIGQTSRLLTCCRLLGVWAMFFPAGNAAPMSRLRT